MERTTLQPFAWFLDGLVVAFERGTPLADLLRAQAADVREAGKGALLDEVGGRREISMVAANDGCSLSCSCALNPSPGPTKACFRSVALWVSRVALIACRTCLGSGPGLYGLKILSDGVLGDLRRIGITFSIPSL